MKEYLVFPVLIILLFGTPAFADFADGKAAYDKGDYATALMEWKLLAEHGDAVAANAMGILYFEGKGVTQDYKAALKWYKLSAEQGYAAAAVLSTLRPAPTRT